MGSPVACNGSPLGRHSISLREVSPVLRLRNFAKLLRVLRRCTRNTFALRTSLCFLWQSTCCLTPTNPPLRAKWQAEETYARIAAEPR